MQPERGCEWVLAVVRVDREGLIWPSFAIFLVLQDDGAIVAEWAVMKLVATLGMVTEPKNLRPAVEAVCR